MAHWESDTARTGGILWVPVLMGAGIGLFFALPQDPPLWLGGALLLASLSLAGILRRTHAPEYLPRCLLALACVALGLCAIQSRTETLRAPILSRETGIMEVKGRIIALSRQPNNRTKIILDQIETNKLSQEETPRSVQLVLRKGGEGLHTGDHVKLLAKLLPPSGPVMPGAQDFRRDAYFRGIGAVGYALGAPREHSPASEPAPLFAKAREQIGDSIRKALPGHPMQGVIVALMTGEKDALNDEEWQDLRGSGLAHLIVLSGMNVWIVAGAALFFSRALMAAFPWFALRVPIKKVAALIGFLAACAYTFTVAPGVPTERALITVGLAMLAILLDRSPISLRLIAFAATLVLLIWPDSLIGPSFQMSFAVVVALVLFYEETRSFWERRYAHAGWIRRGWLYLEGIAVTTIIATITVAPISLYHFQTLAIYGLPANLLAVPLMSLFLMPLAVLSYLLIPLGWAGGILSLMTIPAGWTMEVAHAVAHWPGAILRVEAWPASAFLLCLSAGLTLVLIKNRWRWVALPLLTGSVIMVFIQKQTDIVISSDLEIIAVRTQDDAVLFQTPKRDRFRVDQVAARMGADPENIEAWPYEGGAPDHSMACDPDACRLNRAGNRVSIVKTPYAMKEECAAAELVIATFPVSRGSCRGADRVIDKWAAKDHGPYTVSLTEQGITVKRLRRTRRPWDEPPQEYRRSREVKTP